MKDFVKRLNESRERTEGAARNDGAEWARERAEYWDLTRLSRLDLNDFETDSETELGTLGEWVDDKLGRGVINSIFPTEDYPNDEYVVAFVNGALRVLNEYYVPQAIRA